MTEDAKFDAIIERLGKFKSGFHTPLHVDVFTITGYLSDLEDNKVIIGGQFSLTKDGKYVLSVIEEFDWKPTDESILRYVGDFVPYEEREGFFLLLKKYRDDRESLFSDFERFKNGD
jgi:hypothetical protein